MRILTSAEMAAVDRAATRKAKIPSILLMERAAEGVADLLEQVLPRARRVAVLCGPGNNGGDGLAVARLLQARGIAAPAFLLVPASRFGGDAAVNLRAAVAAGVAVEELGNRLPDAVSCAEVVIDALFGTGLSRPLSGRARAVVEAVGRAGVSVLSIDVPSGLSGDSGAVPGPAFAAAWTAAIGAPKLCHVLQPAAALCGEIAVVDIGIPESLIEIPRHRFAAISREAIAPLFPPRPPESHKGDSGHVVVVAGSRGKAGAALLAARGAFRAGAGLVTIAAGDSIEPRFTAALPEAMTLPLPDTGGELSAEGAGVLLDLLARADAAAVGPGLGRGEGVVRLLARIVAESRIPLLLDADALNAFEGRPERLRRRRAATVITPHAGEAGRLLGVSPRRVQQDRPEAARELARRTGAIAVLKGAGTLVAEPGGRLWWNPAGCPALATAGAGDVLSGIGAAFLAAGLDAVDAAVAAAFVHGLAGETAQGDYGTRGATAGDVAERVPSVLLGLS
jgi:ADP-dependent NAD(P)H-hydrate dehydratase / NAD(P)H-hydrate epimerase